MTETRRVFNVMNLRTGEATSETYANVKNVIRFGLAKDKYDAGQYDIYDTVTRETTRAYKRV